MPIRRVAKRPHSRSVYFRTSRVPHLLTGHARALVCYIIIIFFFVYKKINNIQKLIIIKKSVMIVF